MYSDFGTVTLTPIDAAPDTIPEPASDVADTVSAPAPTFGPPTVTEDDGMAYLYAALAAGWTMADAKALVVARAEALGLVDDSPATLPHAPTVQSPRGLAVVARPIDVRVAA